MRETFPSFVSLNANTPLQIDASYQHPELSLVPTVRSISKLKQATSPTYKINLAVTLPRCKVDKMVLIGSETEIQVWLENLKTAEYVKEWVTDIYRDLSQL